MALLSNGSLSNLHNGSKLSIALALLEQTCRRSRPQEHRPKSEPHKTRRPSHIHTQSGAACTLTPNHEPDDTFQAVSSLISDQPIPDRACWKRATTPVECCALCATVAGCVAFTASQSHGCCPRFVAPSAWKPATNHFGRNPTSGVLTSAPCQAECELPIELLGKDDPLRDRPRALRNLSMADFPWVSTMRRSPPPRRRREATKG